MFQVSAIIRCPASRGAEQASIQLCNLRVLNLKSQGEQKGRHLRKWDGLEEGDAPSADTEAAVTKSCIWSGQRCRAEARFELWLRMFDFWICSEQPRRKRKAAQCHRAGSFPPGGRAVPWKSEIVLGLQWWAVSNLTVSCNTGLGFPLKMVGFYLLPTARLTQSITNRGSPCHRNWWRPSVLMGSKSDQLHSQFRFRFWGGYQMWQSAVICCGSQQSLVPEEHSPVGELQMGIAQKGAGEIKAAMPSPLPQAFQLLLPAQLLPDSRQWGLWKPGRVRGSSSVPSTQHCPNSLAWLWGSPKGML